MIGLGIVTHKRFGYLMQCLTAAKKNNWGGADHVVVVEDGRDYTLDEQEEIHFMLSSTNGVYIRKDNGGVATAKNKAVKHLMSRDVEHIFLMEDDILMKSPDVCQEYIEWAEIFGIEHMNFALHGSMNIGKMGMYKRVTVYPQCVGAFSYYTANLIKKVGYFDEMFINAWEHVEHTWRISKAGLTTPFWKFADAPNSGELLTEIEGSIDNSSIRPRDDWQENIKNGRLYWINKHGEFIF